jgi:hypothetical protein
MKKFVLGLIFALVANIAHAATVPDRFYISGSGFGHGVGLSQIGAKGLALEGKSATEITNYFFPGTSVVTNQDLGNIRVNIAHATTYVTVTGAASLNRADGTPVAAIPAGSTLKFAAVSKTISPTIATPKMKALVIPASATWSVTWESGTVVTVNNGGATTKLAYGQINVKSVANKIELTATMRLNDQYVYGISEVSSACIPHLWIISNGFHSQRMRLQSIQHKV